MVQVLILLFVLTLPGNTVIDVPTIYRMYDKLIEEDMVFAQYLAGEKQFPVLQIQKTDIAGINLPGCC